MGTNRIDGDLQVTGNVTVGGQLLPALARASLLQQDFASFRVGLESFRVWDSFLALTTPGNDDLGFACGTWGTGAPYLSAGDLKTAGATTRRARALIQLPHEYVAGQSVQLVLAAGMLTTVADGSCTVDVEVYRLDEDATVGGSDLVSTSATTINSLTFVDKVFAIDGSGLSPGDWLDVRVSIACTDTATVGAVIPAVATVELQCDVKG